MLGNLFRRPGPQGVVVDHPRALDDAVHLGRADAYAEWTILRQKQG